jgi:hypothetical protein
MITAKESFTISNDTAAPILNPLPELTNQAKINVPGQQQPKPAWSFLTVLAKASL